MAFLMGDTSEKVVTHPEQFLCLAVPSTYASSALIIFITYIFVCHYYEVT